MKTHASRIRIRQRRPRRGTVVVLVLFLMVALLALAAFAINISYMQLTRSQLRRATDAAARAGGECIYRTQNKDDAIEAAQEAALQNPVAGQPLELKKDQIIFGNAAVDEYGKWRFTAGAKPYNSVQVDGSRAKKSKDGSVSLFFGRVLGRGDFEPELRSTAARAVVPRDFGLVIDRSGSMEWPASGGTMSRWKALLLSIDGFTKALNDSPDEELVGMATYSSSSTIDEPLEYEYGVTNKILKETFPAGSTNIHSGITNGTIVLTGATARSDARKIMVVMTDGLHNTGPEPILAAQNAVLAGIQIFAVTFGEDADIHRMEQIAELGGGKHYYAPGPKELEAAFQQIILDSAGMVFVQ